MKLSPLRNYWILSMCALISAQALIIIWRFAPGGWGFQGSDSYSFIAQHLVQSGTFVSTMRPPVYPIFLATTIWTSPDSWQLVSSIFQACLAVVLGCLIMLATRRLFDERSAIAAMVLYLSHILFQIEVGTKRETIIFTMLAFVFVHIIPVFIHSKQSRNLLWAFSSALAFLTRASGVVLLPLFLFLILYRQSVRNSLLPVLFMVTLVLPWQLTLMKISGKLSFHSATTSGQNLWKGNNPYFFQLWPAIDLDVLDPYLHQKFEAHMPSVDTDEELRRDALKFIYADPKRFIALSILKFFAFFNPVPTPLGRAKINMSDQALTVVQFVPRNRFLQLFGTLHFVLLLLGFLDFLRSWPKHSETVRLVGLSTLFFGIGYALLHAVCVPELRFRLPFDILITPLAAAALCARLGWVQIGVVK